MPNFIWRCVFSKVFRSSSDDPSCLPCVASWLTKSATARDDLLICTSRQDCLTSEASKESTSWYDVSVTRCNVHCEISGRMRSGERSEKAKPHPKSLPALEMSGSFREGLDPMLSPLSFREGPGVRFAFVRSCTSSNVCWICSVVTTPCCGVIVIYGLMCTYDGSNIPSL